MMLYLDRFVIGGLVRTAERIYATPFGFCQQLFILTGAILGDVSGFSSWPRCGPAQVGHAVPPHTGTDRPALLPVVIVMILGAKPGLTCGPGADLRRIDRVARFLLVGHSSGAAALPFGLCRAWEGQTFLQNNLLGDSVLFSGAVFRGED